jgi:hypothetical protein
VAALALLVLLPAAPAEARRSLFPYRGLGAWIDIFDDAAWDDPAGTVRSAAERGVRTIYLETCNWRCERDLFRPPRIADFIRAGNANGVRIVAWYLPGFDNLRRDFRRSKRAIEFETSGGQRFDGFALDIESFNVASVTARNRRLLRLSRDIRDFAGPRYPLGAITPPWFYSWEPFPYRALAAQYDAFLPMNYFTVRANGARAARRHTVATIREIRSESGIRNVPIHVIGGIADEMNGRETRALVRTGREHGVLGMSLYDMFTSSGEDWSELAKVPVNPRQDPALPVGLGFGRALGNLPNGDSTHPKEVFFRASGRSGGWTLRFEATGIQPGEVAVIVNWHPVGNVHATGGSWEQQRIRIPARYLRGDSQNTIGFVADGRYPDWHIWGVRDVRLVRR